MLTVDGIQLEIIQRVVHPAEVPLVPEAQSAGLRRSGHAREVGGLFCHAHGAWYQFAQHAVGFAQEFDGFKVFAAAVLVRDPLPLFAAVVAVNHGGHCIHTQGINAEALYPVQGVADQVVADFATTVVINQRVPVLVIAFARIAVFIQVRAVKFGETEIIFREVTRHPVEDHA